MLHGRRFKQSSIFEYRLEEEAINLRKQAEGMPPGIRRVLVNIDHLSEKVNRSA
jgi:hypothetical protein